MTTTPLVDREVDAAIIAGGLKRYLRHYEHCPAMWSNKNVFGELCDNTCTCGLDAALAVQEMLI